MKRLNVLGVALVLFAAMGCQPAANGDAEEEFTTLFDGTTLDGWNIVGDANWQLADGAVEATSGSGYLVTPASYGNFELRLEFWVDEPANSGIFIRCSDPQEIAANNSYEVNIYDTRPDQTYRTGGIVDVAAPSSQINAGGQWNTYVITADGPRLTVVLNGTQTVDAEDTTYAAGPIALQYGAGIVRFRNVRIREL